MFHPTYTAIHLNSTPTGVNSHPQELKSKNILKEYQTRYGIDEHIRFNEAVIRCTWMDGEWEIETEKGHIERVRWVIAATGILHHPKYPDIDGLDTFEGPMFHTARWDHDIDITGKRIGLIGTGSSGVQITAAVAPRFENLTVFQRTAQWIVPNDRVVYTEEEKEAFRTDADLLQKPAQRNVNCIQ